MYIRIAAGLLAEAAVARAHGGLMDVCSAAAGTDCANRSFIIAPQVIPPQFYSRLNVRAQYLEQKNNSQNT